MHEISAAILAILRRDGYIVSRIEYGPDGLLPVEIRPSPVDGSPALWLYCCSEASEPGWCVATWPGNSVSCKGCDRMLIFSYPVREMTPDDESGQKDKV